MRPWVEEVYGIPADQVVGSSIKTEFVYNNGNPVIRRLAEIDFIDDKGRNFGEIIRHIALDFVCGLVLENVFGEDAPTSSGQSNILKQRAIKMLDKIRDGDLLLEHTPLVKVTPSVIRPNLDSNEESRFAVSDIILTFPEDS